MHDTGFKLQLQVTGYNMSDAGCKIQDVGPVICDVRCKEHWSIGVLENYCS